MSLKLIAEVVIEIPVPDDFTEEDLHDRGGLDEMIRDLNAKLSDIESMYNISAKLFDCTVERHGDYATEN
ncbi:hypothetical protein PP301_gp065 [Gordonia phage GMA2]|uniref:Uncharacterized protein n=1 Tax=Gordonia phage GMA2 TaxID=1647283 RepID=A0A0K0N7D3_9CAUD|nr:hypothetical protein PP301_gp065 [Gordonia phage GMA2]AKJ72657.1 hypothetical protein GMA2_119 [Gordonia phage GMA2]